MYLRGIAHVRHRYNECITVHGYYVEKQSSLLLSYVNRLGSNIFDQLSLSLSPSLSLSLSLIYIYIYMCVCVCVCVCVCLFEKTMLHCHDSSKGGRVPLCKCIVLIKNISMTIYYL